MKLFICWTPGPFCKFIKFTPFKSKSFSKKSRNILAKKKQLILIESKKFLNHDKQEIKSINGGYLIQEKNNNKLRKNHIKSVSNNKASKKILDDLIFCFKVCKHVKSNAIVLVKN